MDVKKAFFELADELDRHFVNPSNPQILYLSPDDHKEFEIGLKDIQDNSTFTATYTKGSYGEGTTWEAIDFTVAGYTFTIMKAEKSSLIWNAIKG